MNAPAPLDKNRIVLAPHDPQWAALAAAEGAKLQGLLGRNLLRCEHIGSTSIPGIVAKPVVDLLPVVRSVSEVDACRSLLEAAGYRFWGEYGIAGRRFLTLAHSESGQRLFNVHCFQEGDPQIERHLVFRDYLRAHPAEALAYEAAKRRAAEASSHDVNAYNDHKSPWILACDLRAAAWAERT